MQINTIYKFNQAEVSDFYEIKQRLSAVVQHQNELAAARQAAEELAASTEQAETNLKKETQQDTDTIFNAKFDSVLGINPALLVVPRPKPLGGVQIENSAASIEDRIACLELLKTSFDKNDQDILDLLLKYFKQNEKIQGRILAIVRAYAKLNQTSFVKFINAHNDETMFLNELMQSFDQADLIDLYKSYCPSAMHRYAALRTDAKELLVKLKDLLLANNDKDFTYHLFLRLFTLNSHTDNSNRLSLDELAPTLKRLDPIGLQSFYAIVETWLFGKKPSDQETRIPAYKTQEVLAKLTEMINNPKHYDLDFRVKLFNSITEAYERISRDDEEAPKAGYSQFAQDFLKSREPRILIRAVHSLIKERNHQLIIDQIKAELEKNEGASFTLNCILAANHNETKSVQGWPEYDFYQELLTQLDDIEAVIAANKTRLDQIAEQPDFNQKKLTPYTNVYRGIGIFYCIQNLCEKSERRGNFDNLRKNSLAILRSLLESFKAAQAFDLLSKSPNILNTLKLAFGI